MTVFFFLIEKLFPTVSLSTLVKSSEHRDPPLKERASRTSLCHCPRGEKNIPSGPVLLDRMSSVICGRNQQRREVSVFGLLCETFVIWPSPAFWPPCPPLPLTGTQSDCRGRGHTFPPRLCVGVTPWKVIFHLSFRKYKWIHPTVSVSSQAFPRRGGICHIGLVKSFFWKHPSPRESAWH